MVESLGGLSMPVDDARRFHGTLSNSMSALVVSDWPWVDPLPSRRSDANSASSSFPQFMEAGNVQGWTRVASFFPNESRADYHRSPTWLGVLDSPPATAYFSVAYLWLIPGSSIEVTAKCLSIDSEGTNTTR